MRRVFYATMAALEDLALLHFPNMCCVHELEQGRAADAAEYGVTLGVVKFQRPKDMRDLISPAITPIIQFTLVNAPWKSPIFKGYTTKNNIWSCSA